MSAQPGVESEPDFEQQTEPEPEPEQEPLRANMQPLPGPEPEPEPEPKPGSVRRGERRLQVALLECRGLKKMDGRFGSNDVFVTLDLDGDAQKSSTVDDGGAAPAWRGGAGESFVFGALGLPQRLRVEAFDEDVGSADDSIGSHAVDLASIVPGDQDWSSCEWYNLEDEKGKMAGEVRLFMRWGVPTPTDAPREWQLQVTVLECDGLKKMDLTGQNDVYVKLEVDGAEEPHRSSTIEGGGTAPVWSEGAGETMTFRLGAAPPSVGIEVFDEDQGSADDLIGTHVLEIGTQVSATEWSMDERWLDLTSSKEGKVTGRVRVGVSWSLAPADAPEPTMPLPRNAAAAAKRPANVVLPTHPCLQVSLLECRGLAKMDGRFGSNDVFVTLDLDGDVQKSSTVDDGGAAPVWLGGAGESFVFAAADPPQRLRVEAFDEDVGSADDSIGSHAITLADIIESDEDWSGCEWYNLEDEKGKAAGEVRLFMRWGVPTPTDAPREWQLQVTVLECDELKKMDLTGQNDVYVKLQVAGAPEANRSSTIQGGGAAPVWGEGAGEKVAFRVGAAPPSVGIEVYDEDKGSADDLIGTHVLEVGTKMGGGEWAMDGAWLDLTSSKEGKVTGRVRVGVGWSLAPLDEVAAESVSATDTAASGDWRALRLEQAHRRRELELQRRRRDVKQLKLSLTPSKPAKPARQPVQKRLIISVLECRGLKKMDRFGSNDVFVKLEVDGQTLRSSTIDKGGAAPAWGGGSGEAITFKPARPPTTLVVQAFDEDKGSADDLIGSHILSLSKLALERREHAAAETAEITALHDAYQASMAADSAGELHEQICKGLCDAVCAVHESPSRSEEHDWNACEWYGLRDDKRKAVGEVRLFMRWAVPTPPDAPREWQLQVTVLECDGLKKMDLAGQNDVYVKVQVDGAVAQRSSTIEGGGAAPVWGDGAGETMTFRAGCVPPSVGIEVFDEDQGSADDLIGTHVLEVGTQIVAAGAEWAMEGSWLDLTSSKEGRATGRVRVCMQWSRVSSELVVADQFAQRMVKHAIVHVAKTLPWFSIHAPEPETSLPAIVEGADKPPPMLRVVLPTYSCLQVTLLECRGLPKMDGRFGSNDVFVTLDLDGDVKESSTIDDGGEAPAWQGGAGESFAFGASDPPKRLRVEAFDEDVGSADDSIGSHTVDLASIVPGNEDWSRCEWYNLEDEKGKAAGEVRLFMRWGVPTPSDAPREWQLQVTVLECDGLKKMDLTGQNDVYVKLEVDSAEEPHRSSTIEGGGTAPVWSEGAGETMTFWLGAAPPSVGIEVFDEDQGSADDLIGTHVLEIGVKLDMRANPKSGGWSLQNWFDIADRRGNVTGRVRLRLEWMRDPLLPPLPEAAPTDAREVLLLLDAVAHSGGTLARTVLYHRGSVASLRKQSATRFLLGFAPPSRFHRSSPVYREENCSGRAFRDAFEDGDVLLVYRVADGLTGVCAQPVDDAAIVARVRHEIDPRWVKVDRSAEEGADAGAVFWQKWIGSKETPEIIFKQPPPLPPPPPITLATVTTDAELAALGEEVLLWAYPIRSQPKPISAAARADIAALRVQTRARGLLGRCQAKERHSSVLLVQRGAQRWCARQELKRRKQAAAAAAAEAAAAARAQAKYSWGLSAAKSLASSMGGMLKDMHKIIASNDNLLRGSAGWAAYSKSREKEASAALALMESEIAADGSASGMEHALSKYESSAVFDPEVSQQMRARIAERKGLEADAIAAFRASVADTELQAAGLVKMATGDDEENWRRRRYPMMELLRKQLGVITDAEKGKMVGAADIELARESHARLSAQENKRIEREDLILRAGEAALNSAFASSVKWLFQPSGADADDGLTAHQRRQLEVAREQRQAELDAKGWRSFFDADGKERTEPLNEGRPIGVFTDLSTVDGGKRKLMKVAPSNENQTGISPAYASMIARRHAEERSRRRRPEASMTKYKYSEEADPFTPLRLPSVKPERLHKPAQEEHPLLQGDELPQLGEAYLTPSKGSAQGEQTPSPQRRGRRSVRRSGAALEVSPALTECKADCSCLTCLKRRNATSAKDFLSSGSPGDFKRGQSSFMEGWVQLGAHKLDRGEGLPAIGGANPLAGLRKTPPPKLEPMAKPQSGPAIDFFSPQELLRASALKK